VCVCVCCTAAEVTGSETFIPSLLCLKNVNSAWRSFKASIRSHEPFVITFHAALKQPSTEAFQLSAHQPGTSDRHRFACFFSIFSSLSSLHPLDFTTQFTNKDKEFPSLRPRLQCGSEDESLCVCGVSYSDLGCFKRTQWGSLKGHRWPPMVSTTGSKGTPEHIHQCLSPLSDKSERKTGHCCLCVRSGSPYGKKPHEFHTIRVILCEVNVITCDNM
jgi:hypothetical protein